MASRRLLSLRSVLQYSSVIKCSPAFSRGVPDLSCSLSTSIARYNAPFSLTTETEPVMLPKKEALLTIDWILEGLTPNFMKTRLQPIFEKMDQEVDFIDEIYGYKAKGISELGVHITKVRTYFRWKSPYNKVAHLGSYLFEDDNKIVLLWGLETIDSNFWTYLPSFITGRENKPKIIEGALQFTVSPEGKITKIVNRKVTEKDKELAKEFRDLKTSENARFDQEDRKAAEKELKEKIERQEV